ncbi:bacterio-opsin activator-like transcription regulator [Halosimplex carlsbadense 2-9-1]|uniref:Bacterio-opsin activator-like transcription regulator n=1 Tax=Halosimplex carlsbadense 2-9-1 TaxID=797114 RepID=M0CFA5_9EURY|nr:PAS domain S-box protein [Halosimplex carlsbadense]ELZ20549.1 bacterio-opsin activator-like transcription regulator [Halosimplex carlsbadense 2-9-1]
MQTNMIAMFPVGTDSLRCAVVATDAVAAALSGATVGGERSLSVETVDPGAAADGRVTEREADCLVVDGGAAGVDAEAVLERWRAERPDSPVVVLTEEWDDTREAAALSAGATETLPRRLAETNPALLGERVRSAVDREHASDAVRALYETVAGVAAVHDPETGALIDANRAFCELVGADRETVRSMALAELTAEVPGYDRERLANAVTSVADRTEGGPEGADPIELEWPVETADGSVRWVESRLRPVALGGRTVVLGASVDVTERRRRERAYEQVFDNVNDVITVHDPWAERLVEVNETMADLTGYSREALVEMDVEGFTDDDAEGSDAVYETQQRVAATGEAETVEWVVETAAGERRLLEANLAPATIAGEDRVLALARDVTERRESQRRLERERDRRSALFENNPDPMLRVRFEDETPIIREINPAFETVFGYSAAEVVGSGVGEAVVPASERAEFERLRAKVARGEPVEREITRQTADGTREFLVRVIHFDADPATDADGVADLDAASDAYVWYTDVTERRELERTYRNVFESVSDGLLLHDPDTGEITDANDRFCAMNGYEREELVGETIDVVAAGDHGYEDARERIRAAREEGPQLFEWRNRREDGETFPVEVHLSVVDVRGEERVLGSVRDVTERKRRERMVRALHESTDDLQDTETPRAVCEAAVEAATEVLDLWLPTCWLRDGVDAEAGGGDSDALVPVAAGDAADRLPPDQRPRALDPDDLEYEAYETGEGGVYDPADLDGGTPPGDALLVPLGEHGLLGAVDRDGDGFDDVTLDAAGILARHVTTALDRVERARRLRESERRFRLIADHIDDIVYLATADFSEIRYINDAYEDIYGRPVAELDEDPTAFVEAAHPDDRGRYEADVERVIADVEAGDPEDAYEGQYRIERDGETRWVSVTRFPVEGDDGTVDRIVGRVQDVTERKRRQREYEQIFDGVTDAITVFDPAAGEVTDVNETYREMLGYDLEAIRELGIEGLSATDEGYTGERGWDLIREVAETGEPETVEWCGLTRSGERVWLEATLAPAEIGGELRVLSIQRDVTERKRRQREYEQIFDGVTDAITVHDPETGEILDCNERMCELTGYDREALLAGGMDAINVPEEGYSSERARGIIRDVMDADEPESHEWLIERADGERRRIEVNNTPATINGQRRYLAIMRDITERRRTERRLGAILDRIDEAIFMTRAREITAASQAPDYVSAGYERIWGQSLETLRETHEDGFFGTLHPDDEGEYRSFVAGIVDDVEDGTAADSYSHEYRIERPDGDRRWVQSDFYPADWDTGDDRIVIVSRDVTDRKARERRMASFEDATDDLATADTPEEATRSAVEAAAETLDLSAVGAFLYDADDGVLRPEVLTGPLPDAEGVDPVGPGGGRLWEGFATGTVVAPDGGREETGFVGGDGADGGGDDPAVLAALSTWRALALGNHGVLLVGAPDEELGSEAIQGAHVLAATLEAALNHLEGRKRLEAREEQLRTQTERAERLDRIARLTQRVEAAITNATDPGEVERAVCERLASSGPYDLAWVGGVEVGADRLAARAVVGAPEGYVERLDLTTTADTADPHPAVTAWRRDEVRVADSLVGDGPTDDWRRHGLSEGFQSLCAVPLTYDGITHGVLTVGTDSPNAFGEREREVLAQLGTSIANALAAIERRRALESDETVELEFAGPGDALPFARAAGAADCPVSLERTVSRGDGSVSVYYGFEGDVPDDAPAIARRTLPGSVDVVAEEASSTLVETRAEEWFGAPLAEYGGVLRAATADPDEATVVVEVPRQADVRSFVERLAEIAPSLELTARRQHRQRDRTPAELADRAREDLTDRQFEVLRTALSAGYFQWPRENDGSEVADRLDITQPTFNKHLRIAEREVFGLLFGADS